MSRLKKHIDEFDDVPQCYRCKTPLRVKTSLVFLTSEINTPLQECVPYERIVVCKNCYKDFTKWIGADPDE